MHIDGRQWIVIIDLNKSENKAGWRIDPRDNLVFQSARRHTSRPVVCPHWVYQPAVWAQAPFLTVIRDGTVAIGKMADPTIQLWQTNRSRWPILLHQRTL